jgi:hypothetical protein
VISVFAGTQQFQKTVTIPVTPGKPNSVVVTEKRSAGQTASIQVFVNGGPATVISVAAGAVFAFNSNNVLLAGAAGAQVDEYEFWTEDLGGNQETLCENGFDGEFDLLTGSCSLTSN